MYFQLSFSGAAGLAGRRFGAARCGAIRCGACGITVVGGMRLEKMKSTVQRQPSYHVQLSNGKAEAIPSKIRKALYSV